MARPVRAALAVLCSVACVVLLVAGTTQPSSHAAGAIRPARTVTATVTRTVTATATQTVTATATATATATVTQTETVTAQPTASDPAYLPGWGLPVWDDEFAGTTVDGTHWNVRNNDTANGMLERRMAANVTVAGGHLVETARQENIPGTTQQYTSGYVDTIGKPDAIGPGTLTLVRAKFPTDADVGKGMWSALWFRGDTGPGEADLVEAYSNKPDLANAWECVVITVHERTDGTGSKKSFVYRFPAGQFPSQVEHTYGMEVAPDRLRFSIDGTVVFEPTVAQYPWMAAMLADTWNLRVNQQISAASTWFYAPDAGTVFPREMDVDFVRVYKPVA